MLIDGSWRFGIGKSMQDLSARVPMDGGGWLPSALTGHRILVHTESGRCDSPSAASPSTPV